MRSQKKKAVKPGKKVKACLSLLLPFTFLLLPSAAVAQAIRLGVVRSPENATQWGGISTRLNQSGLAYCVVDLQNVQNATDLSGSTVLFLPNVEKLTPEQALALEAWISKGGRAIVSGPMGNLSPPAVRQLLRSLLGAYWAFPLSEPTAVKPIRTRTQEWVRNELGGTIHGGVVIPSGLNSQTAATWSGPENPPAVVTTHQVTFFGWRWGVDAASSAALDLGWLRAALSRYGSLPQAGALRTQNASNCINPATATTATTPRESQPVIVRAGGQMGRVRERESGRAGERESGRAGERESGRAGERESGRAGERESGRAGERENSPSPITNSPSPTTVDPTERVSAAGISIQPNAQSISPVQAIAMRQELENLIGRVESALLAANAANSNVAGERGRSEKTENPSPATTGNPNPPASTVASTSLVSAQNSAPSALQAAREVLQAFPQLIAKGDHTSARQQWLQARQSLWNLYPTDRPHGQTEIRAIWLDRGSIVQARSEQGLARIFDRLAQAGINTVFFETVNAGYPIYPSQVAPEQNPLTKGWDPLAAAVKLAHERGMELHAWVWTFAVGNQRHNGLLNQPADYLGPVLTAHPNWANYDNRGRIIPEGQTKPFLDPANPEARRYLLQLFNEIVSRYKVDGLQLDYIRYPFQDPSRGATYGYGQAARQQFQQLTGVDPQRISPNERTLFSKWTEFRTNQVNSFVAEVAQMLRQRRSNLILSVAVFAFPEQERMQKLQQNWEVWTRRGDVDLVVPMAYAADTNRFQQLVQPWLTNANIGSSLISPGIYLLSLPEVGTMDQIQLIRDLPSGGYSLFALEHFSSRLQGIFNRTQGTMQRSSKDPIPYRQPFAAAEARYAALVQEWNFLQARNQLQMLNTARTSWRTQANELSTALTQLVKEPTPNNLVAARKSLMTFRSQFRDWMRLYGMQHPYQVQTWDNRLASMERLLSYGERLLLNRQDPPAAQR